MKRAGTQTPPEWSYNPSAWLQRLPIVALAVCGFAVAMYLSLYQWGVVQRVWDPIFGADGFDGGSREILRGSTISKRSMSILGIPDAFLGALTYLADAVTGLIGGRSRWRSMPWIVILFGILAGPLGAVSVFLVIAQPVFSSSWCSLCLLSAVISVLMIGPAMDEVLASLQHLARERAVGRSVWRTFWGLGKRRPAGRIGRQAVGGAG